MAPRFFIVVIHQARPSLYEAGSELFELLLQGPSGLEAVAALPSVEALPRRIHAAWLADLDHRRVVLFHAERGQVVLPRIERIAEVYRLWDGFTVRWTDASAGGLAGYLSGDHQIFAPEAPPAPPPVEDPPPDGRDEQLRALEEALPKPPPEAAGVGGLGVFLLTLATVGLAGLVVRLLTLPFRAQLRARAKRRQLRRAEEADASTKRALEAASGDSIDARFERGLAFLMGARWWSAEALFDECVRRMESGERPQKVTLARALHNRGVARGSLRFPALSAQDLQRAKALEPSVGAPTLAHRLRGYGQMASSLFREIAGLLA